VTTPKNPAAVRCACHEDPMHSNCGDWRDNTSACICVEYGLAGQLPP
jgi:hypothetical protein